MSLYFAFGSVILRGLPRFLFAVIVGSVTSLVAKAFFGLPLPLLTLGAAEVDCLSMVTAVNSRQFR
jgi:hypothetical protein